MVLVEQCIDLWLSHVGQGACGYISWYCTRAVAIKHERPEHTVGEADEAVLGLGLFGSVVCHLCCRIREVGLDVDELGVVDCDASVHHLCHVAFLLTVLIEDKIGGEEYVRGVDVDLSTGLVVVVEVVVVLFVAFDLDAMARTVC